MDLRSLNVFVEVVQQGGFTAASTRLHLTQPSISRVIKQLEDDLGQVLISRKHRDIVLTDSGQVVYRRALFLLRESAALETELAELAGLKRGQLTLGIPALGGTLFVPLIKLFKTRYPAIDLRLMEQGSKATEKALMASGMDLGTLIMPVDDSRFDYLQLSKDRLMLLAPKQSRFAAQSSVRLADLRNESFILYPEGFGLNDRILEACRAAGFEPSIASRSGHAQFIVGLVDSGVGLALVPQSVAQNLNEVVMIELSEPVIEWNIALAWARDSYLSYAAKAMIALAKKHPIIR